MLKKVLVFGPVLEGEFNCIEQVRDQAQNARRNRGVAERVIHLPTKFSLYDTQTNELLISSSNARAISKKSGADAGKKSLANIHDVLQRVESLFFARSAPFRLLF